ncbi:unnamed protein product [Phytomonas sp. EM1]|nr:unnamed protein product [Phytomonas sp. EM1]|eukprot:CCW63956.1 unnamed protein product [Phytomonas sp. isolate EM1]
MGYTVPHPHPRAPPPPSRSNVCPPSSREPSASAESSHNRRISPPDLLKSLFIAPDPTHTIHSPEGPTHEGLIIRSLSVSHLVQSTSSISPGHTSLGREEPPQLLPSSLTNLPPQKRLSRPDALAPSTPHLSFTPTRVVEEAEGREGAAIIPPPPPLPIRASPPFMFFPTFKRFTELQIEIKNNFPRDPATSLSSRAVAAAEKGNPRRGIRKPARTLCSSKVHLASRLGELAGYIPQGYPANLPAKRADPANSQDLLAKGCGLKASPESGKDAPLTTSPNANPAVRDLARLGRQVVHLEGFNQRYQPRGLMALLRKRTRSMREQRRRSLSRKPSSSSPPTNGLSIIKPYYFLDVRQTTTSLPMLRRMLHWRRTHASTPLSGKKKDSNMRWGGSWRKREED